MTAIGDYLRFATLQHPEKIALVTKDSRMSYISLSTFSDSLSSWLLAQGLKKGDRVVVCLENSIETVISIFGILRAGGCIVVLNPTTPSEGIQYVVENCHARFLISRAEKTLSLSQSTPNWNWSPRFISIGTTTVDSSIFDDIIRFPQISPFPTIEGNDLAAIIYTSGSTGKPKGVTLTHRNIDVVVESVVQYLKNTSDDIILCVLQLSFGYGLLQLLATFRTCARLILEKGIIYPYDVIKRITEERVTGFAGAPTMYAILLQLKDLEKEDFSSLRYITNAAAALPASFVPRLRKVFPSTKIYLMHGLTECLRTTYLPPEEVEKRPTSVGKGMPNVKLWIEDEEGNKIQGGQPGELVVSGPNLMLGYWNDPDATAQRIRESKNSEEKVLYSGDLFRIDEEGYFYFVARKDDVIKCRGEKVSPVEVEDVIYTLEEVLEVRVIAVPDDILGQAVKAEIVLKEGKSLTERKVKAHCQQHLQDFKIPKFVEFVTSLPKTSGGKIRRKVTS
jgi:acyl-CoA synthetase (AMP-forming)/AMP-acid ligase II